MADMRLGDVPDGAVAAGGETLVEEVADEALVWRADGLVVFDRSGVTGHPDHAAASVAALRVGERMRLPALEWTLPEAVA